MDRFSIQWRNGVVLETRKGMYTLEIENPCIVDGGSLVVILNVIGPRAVVSSSDNWMTNGQLRACVLVTGECQIS